MAAIPHKTHLHVAQVSPQICVFNIFIHKLEFLNDFLNENSLFTLRPN